MNIAKIDKKNVYLGVRVPSCHHQLRGIRARCHRICYTARTTYERLVVQTEHQKKALEGAKLSISIAMQHAMQNCKAFVRSRRPLLMAFVLLKVRIFFRKRSLALPCRGSGHSIVIQSILLEGGMLAAALLIRTCPWELYATALFGPSINDVEQLVRSIGVEPHYEN